MKKISLMIHTASVDCFLANQGIESYFESLIKCLNFQSFKDFELIYIDTYYENNKEIFKEKSKQSNFLIKHVELHKNHRYWYDKGYCYISAAKNTGIIHADGELIITCDDAEYFPENLLQKYWDYYKKGFYMLASHKRLKNIKTENNSIKFPIEGEIYINDHRVKIDEEITYHNYGSWAYAGTSFSLKDALILNGFNEKMDGCKSLEDCDFGNRMSLLGRKFVNDKNGFIYILDHKSYGDCDLNWKTEQENENKQTSKEFLINKKIENFIAIENYGILKCAEELYELKANNAKITNEHLKVIQRETFKYRNFDILGEENSEKLKIWLNVPNFSLEKERKEIRNDK